MQRELDDAVKKVVDDKLADPFIATKKGEKEAEEELKKGVERATRQRAKKGSLPPRVISISVMQDIRHNPSHDLVTE